MTETPRKGYPYLTYYIKCIYDISSYIYEIYMYI